MYINKVKKDDKTNHDIFFVHVNRKEAIMLLHSLTSQIMHNNPNYDRLETFTEDGEYFSIAVDPEKEN